MIKANNTPFHDIPTAFKVNMKELSKTEQCRLQNIPKIYLPAKNKLRKKLF